MQAIPERIYRGIDRCTSETEIVEKVREMAKGILHGPKLERP
jgi:hypothetical protein